MSIESLFHRLRNETSLGVPKARYSLETLAKKVGEFAGETSDTWLVPCIQSPGLPAKIAELSITEQHLGINIPRDLRCLLMLSNGGKFYRVPLLWLRDINPCAEHVRYHIFGTQELMEVNQHLYDRFRAVLGNDPDFSGFHSLNYIAFCDAHNGNYLAILLDGPEKGKIFFLHHGYFYRPYSELDADLYYHVAGSLEHWLKLVLKTRGWGGFPEEDVPGL